jgi:hypothetical protein
METESGLCRALACKSAKNASPVSCKLSSVLLYATNPRWLSGLSAALEIVTVDWPGIRIDGGEVGSTVLIVCYSALPSVVRLVEPERGTVVGGRRVVCELGALLSDDISGQESRVGSVNGGKVWVFAWCISSDGVLKQVSRRTTYH